MHFANHLSVAKARERYFDSNGFSEAGYSDRWVRIKFGPIPVIFPNSGARIRALRLHDLHHIATGYDTDLRGEAEQSAWEIGAGCGRHWFAWAINLTGVAYGVFLAPIRTWRAFRRGRRSRTLYSGQFEPALLEQSVGALRQTLELD